MVYLGCVTCLCAWGTSLYEKTFSQSLYITFILKQRVTNQAYLVKNDLTTLVPQCRNPLSPSTLRSSLIHQTNAIRRRSTHQSRA